MGRELIHVGDATNVQGRTSGPMAWLQRSHPSDDWLRQSSPLLARRRELEASLARIEADRAAVTALVASKVLAAIEAAGGSDRAVSAIVAAQALQAPAPAPDAELAAVDGQLEQLEFGGAEEHAEAVHARRRSILDRIATDRHARHARRRDQARSLVAAATSGDEPSRSAIEAILRGAASIAPELLENFTAARADRAIITAFAVQA